jgi:hypothetical protein
MPRYFAVKQRDEDASRTFAAADEIAAAMHASLTSLNVRVVAVRPRSFAGMVFAISARSPLHKDAVTSRLRDQHTFHGLQISRESEKVDGPFVWQ